MLNLPTTPPGGDGPSKEPENKNGLLTTRSAVIFLLAFVIAVVCGGLTYLDTHAIAGALFVAIGAFATATLFGMAIIR